MLELNDYQIDRSSEKAGKWFEHPSGAKFLIARWSNPNAKKLMRRLIPHDPNIRIPVKEQEKALIKVVTETILLDWTGIHKGGVEVEYDPKTAAELFNNDSYFFIVQFIIDRAKEDENFRQEEVEEDIKKSESSISGTSE